MKMPLLFWSLLLVLLICLAYIRLRACQAATCQPLGCCRARQRGRDSCKGKGIEYQKSRICQDSFLVARLLLLPLSAPCFFQFLLPTQHADLLWSAGSGKQSSLGCTEGFLSWLQTKMKCWEGSEAPVRCDWASVSASWLLLWPPYIRYGAALHVHFKWDNISFSLL